MRKSRQFVHALLAYLLMVLCFAFFFKKYNYPLIEISKIRNVDSNSKYEKHTTIKNIFLSFTNSLTQVEYFLGVLAKKQRL